MIRMAFHLELADAKRDDSRAGHDDVSDALEAGYLDEEAGLQSYSIFEKDGHEFGSLQVEDPAALAEAIGASDAMTEWEAKLDDIIAEQTGLDEVYRMV